MISGVHDHELPIQAVELPKSGPAIGVKPDFRVVRPRWDDHDFLGINSLVQNALSHEMVEHDNPCGMSQAEPGTAFEPTRGQGACTEPFRGDGFVRIQVHDPVAEPAAAQPREPGA